MVSANFRLEVTKLDSKTCARMGKFGLGGAKLQTPILWLGHKFGSPPKPWEFLDMAAVIVNAHELLSDKKRLEKAEDQGIHTYLGFNGPVMIDSGGFLFQRRTNLSIDVSKLLQLYLKARPVLGVVLDFPFDPFASRIENESRWARTLENTKTMLGSDSSVPVMPVIHGYTLNDIARACDAVAELTEVRMVGIGSLVPLMKGINGQVDFSEIENRKRSYIEWQAAGARQKYSSRHFVVDAIKFVRNRFPDAFLHVFGVGGTTTMHLMLSLGVDSLDSIGWRLKAGHGAIQLPGIGDRFLKPRHDRNVVRHRRVIDENDKDILAWCTCPVCIGLSVSERVQILDQSFEKRALHNAWVYLEEMRKFKRHVKSGNTIDFLDHRLQAGPFRRLLAFAFNHNETTTESRNAEE